jgi:hypothetical protein
MLPLQYRCGKNGDSLPRTSAKKIHPAIFLQAHYKLVVGAAAAQDYEEHQQRRKNFLNRGTESRGWDEALFIVLGKKINLCFIQECH